MHISPRREANPNVALGLNETFGQAGVDRAKTDEFSLTWSIASNRKACPSM
jgi:hypothetical protein